MNNLYSSLDLLELCKKYNFGNHNSKCHGLTYVYNLFKQYKIKSVKKIKIEKSNPNKVGFYNQKTRDLLEKYLIISRKRADFYIEKEKELRAIQKEYMQVKKDLIKLGEELKK